MIAVKPTVCAFLLSRACGALSVDALVKSVEAQEGAHKKKCQ